MGTNHGGIGKVVRTAQTSLVLRHARLLSRSGRWYRERSDVVVLTRDTPLQLRFQADPSSAPVLRERLGLWLDELGAEDEEAFDISLAANEAFANAVEHPHKPTPDLVDINASSAERIVTIVVRDHGTWAQTRRRDGGRLGVPLMRELMDTVDVDARLDGTTITLRRHLRRHPAHSRSPTPPAQAHQDSCDREPMRVRLDKPWLLRDLCDYLTADGCQTRRITKREAAIIIPGAATAWEATETLKMEIRSWQANHAPTRVSLITKPAPTATTHG